MGTRKNVPPGNDSALGGHKNTVYLVSDIPNSYTTKIAAVSLRSAAHYCVPVDQGAARFKGVLAAGKTKFCEFSGYPTGIAEDYFVLGRDSASVDSWFPTFRGNLVSYNLSTLEGEHNAVLETS